MTHTYFKSLLVLLMASQIAWCQETSKAPSVGKAGGQSILQNRSEESCGLLEQRFCTPDDLDKPWVYWWWLNANVTEQSITRDLEQMKAKGIGGFLLFDTTAYHHDLVPPPKRQIEFMSPRWRELVRHSMSEANRLGLRMSINLSTDAGSLQASWDMEEHAPKQLVWTSADVTGPVQVSCSMEKRAKTGFFQDVALLAVRHADSTEKSDTKKSDTEKPKQSPVELKFSDQWSPIMKKVSRLNGHLILPKNAPVAKEVVDLTSKIDQNGRLLWDVPEGQWTLIRLACETIPDRNQHVDILNAKAVENYFDRMARVILKDAGPLVGKTLTHFYNVSWEGTSPSWTPGFEKEFRKYRGYDIGPYLPILAGIVVENREVSERFQRDFCRTLSDCFLHNCYGTFTKLCHEAGVQWHSESGGPWWNFPLFSHGDQLEFWGHNDMPQGEFWWWPKKYRSNVRRTATAAHIYGKPLVSVEAFTHMIRHWSADPAALKPSADAAFCDGGNFFIWHTFCASPQHFGQPGVVYFAGTHLNPNITWWEQAPPFLDYLARCQQMLQKGRFVADVCCYTTVRNRTNWTRGERWSDNASLNLPKGYTYDLINTDVLLNRLSVEKGNLVLPDGMTYRLLVVDFDQEEVPPEALQKILDLTAAGASVLLGRRQPQRAPGLRGYPVCDQQVQRLVNKLWGKSTEQPQRRTIGKGVLAVGTTVEQELQEKRILPDCDTPWDYIHRSGDNCDIYFLSGSGAAECIFRLQGREPELWDPKTGKIRDAVNYRTTDDGRTIVPIKLPQSGSVFVVFRKPSQQVHLVSTSGPSEGIEIDGRDGSAVRLQIWKEGQYKLKQSQGESATVTESELPEDQNLTGPWQVRFAPGWGAPKSIIFDQLVAWNRHPQNEIKHFSGKATYRKSFELNPAEAAGLVRLHLGTVKNIAQVRVNGRDLGVIWTAPWTVDLTGSVKPGKNELQIDVVNLWVNRLIGDAGLPENQRRTKTNIFLETGKRTRKVFQGFGSTDPLMTSGLLGPVRLEFGKEISVSPKHFKK